MKCRKCRAEIPEGSRFCCQCGANQQVSHRTKARGNGLGSVYQRPNRTWVAVKTVGYKLGDDGKKRRVTRSKSGFKTKREALEYLPLLTGEKAKPAVTFQGLYGMWLPTHQATKSTLDCYKAAYKYFSAVWYTKLDDISIDDLQECLDDCPKGKRTRQNMKALCGLLYKYAIPRGWADRNLGEYLVIHGESDSHKDALPLEALDQLAAHLESVPGADYVYCQCFLGFRPSELLALDCKDYDRKERAFVGGAKTDAGRDRVVTVSLKIQPIVDRLTSHKISGPVFCGDHGQRMGIAAYRALFYRVLDACGIKTL